MQISKRAGVGLALMALGGLLGVACNDSTSSACTGACEHVLNCAYAGLIDAGYGALIPDAGSFCEDSCNSADGGAGSGCKNPGAGFDCISGLSCQDALSLTSGEPSPALQACQAKAECP